MSNLGEVLKEDLKAAIAAFRDDSYDTTNVLANRLMSNAIFGKDRKMFLPGFFLKDVAFHFTLLKARSSSLAFSTAKSYGFTFIENLSKSLPNLNEAQLWSDFLVYNDKLRSFEATEWETKNYSNNVAFTNQSYTWLLEYLQTKRDFLLNPRNFLFKGTIDEMNRIFKAHSADIKDFVFLHLIIALDRNYEYVCRIWNRPDVRLIDEDQVKQLIFPTVDKIIELRGKPFEIEQIDTLLWELVRTWREQFILYGELLSPAIALRKGIELPDDLKRKLTDSLTKTLEKETQ